MTKNDKIIAEALVNAFIQCTTIELSNGVKLAQDAISKKLSLNDSNFDEEQFDQYINKHFLIKLST